MTTYQTPIVAGVFQDEVQARQAFDMLRGADFGQDQVGVALPGASTVTNGLANDFMKLGVPKERASFYEHEFNAGHIVVSVRPDGREKEAKDILRSNGALDFDGPDAASSAAENQPGSSAGAEKQNWNTQGQPTNEASTGNYGQGDYKQNKGQ